MLRSHAFALTASVSILFTIAAGCHVTHVHSSPSPSPGPSYEHVPEPHAPVHVEHHRYTYVHYPSCNVYHDRDRKLWFWIEGREWKVGVELPARYHVGEHEAVTVELETESPCEAKPPAPQAIVDHGPPAHAPAHGYRQKFTYVRYPSTNVYCDRERHLWFWYEGNEWRKGAELPARFRVDNHEAVKVELEDETPYEHARAHKFQAHDMSEKLKSDDHRVSSALPHE